MSRGRVNVAATVPESGSDRASANVIVTWDPDALLDDVEQAIKDAARQAVLRVRESHTQVRVDAIRLGS